ncbi:MAG: DUF350 domain-containing protein [Candidatus Kapaibacterium sp.]
MNWLTLLFVSAATIVIVMIARLVHQMFLKTRLTEVLIQHDNAALGMSVAGYIFGVLLIIISVLTGPGHDDILTDFILVTTYGISGILYMALAGKFGLSFCLNPSVNASAQAGNIASGITVGSGYIATGLIVSGVFSGEGEGNILASLVFLVLGQITLYGCTFLYRFLTTYDDIQEITTGNAAAALSYAGLMIAVGLIVGDALTGEFTSYQEGIQDFSIGVLAVLILYPIRQILVQSILLGGRISLYGGRLDEEISAQKNIAAGVIEAVTYISAALYATHLMG